MDTLLFILLGLALAGTVYALTRGVIAMANGRDMSGRTSNRYMWNRVKFQAIAVLVIVAILALARP